jgi:hypothetical protein
MLSCNNIVAGGSKTNFVAGGDVPLMLFSYSFLR